MKKKEISILIPVYNEVCVSSVDRLLMLCKNIEKANAGFRYEIIVADDCSPRKDTITSNSIIGQKAHCIFIEKKSNTGSAATRNFLATKAQYQWLLFLDCDMLITDDHFIDKYLETDFDGVINGGIAIGKGTNGNLRYLYEKSCEMEHTVGKRSQRPYHCFRSTNFMIEASLMAVCQFDERFQKSGYEDVLFGKLLKERHVSVYHIDNPTTMVDFENNSDYMDKIDRGLTTLHQFRKDLRGFSHMLTIVDGIHLEVVRWIIRSWHIMFGKLERRLLCSSHPSLTIFNIYRLGYYLNLTKND